MTRNNLDQYANSSARLRWPGALRPEQKDNISTRKPRGDSPNAFERDKAGTPRRTQSEEVIETLRQKGGVFVEAVRATRMPMALTDPNLPGNPIVFANDAFLKLSGYSMDEVLGQQPHFMNGPQTDSNDVARFEEALRADQDDIIETVQYRKNGSRFVATVLISAFKDEHGNTRNHFMSWLDVTRRVEAEDELSELKQVQAALRESEARLAADLKGAESLQALSGKLITESDSEELYDAIINAAMEIMEAQYGSLQLLNSEQAQLQLIGWRNFHPDSAAYWQRVNVATGTSCGAALAHGERVIISDVDTSETLKGTESLRQYHLSGIKSVQSTPLATRNGRVIGMISTHWRDVHAPSERELRLFDILARQAADFIERRRAEKALQRSERHARTLLGELQHRVRNTLAIVRSIARRTADNSATVEEMFGHFQGRLDAFSRVQAALTRNANATIDLSSLIEDELAAHGARDGQQIDIDGPEVRLESRTAEQLSLAIHELTTNAVKHGALIADRGQLSINWRKERLNGSEELVLNWTESGVPLDGKGPSPEGFGMELILRSLPYELGGTTSVDLTPGGLRFELRIPLRRPDARADLSASSP